MSSLFELSSHAKVIWTSDAFVGLTVKPNAVVFVTPPPVAVIVIVELPVGVEPLVATVNVEEHVGLQLVGENEAVVPSGNPAAEKVTACVLADTNAALIVLVAVDPATTDKFPELPTEKSNAITGGKSPVVML